MTTDLAILAGAGIGVVVFFGGIMLGGWLRGGRYEAQTAVTTWTGMPPKVTSTVSASTTGAGKRVDRPQTVFTMTEERERQIEDEQAGAHD